MRKYIIWTSFNTAEYVWADEVIVGDELITFHLHGKNVGTYSKSKITYHEVKL